MVFMFWLFLGWFICAELRLFPARDRTVPGNWRDSRLIGGDGAGGFRLCAVGEEAHDDGALFLAKSTSGTRSSRPGALCRAHDHFVPCGRGHGEGRVGGQYDDDGPAVGCFQLVRFAEVVGAEIDRESALVCASHCGAVASGFVAIAGHRLVRVRPTPFPLVRVYQLGEHGDIDRIISTGKIARLVMPPQLAKGEGGNARDKRLPIVAPICFRHLAPVKREGTARTGITAFRFERARVWAGGRCGSGNRNRPSLYVAALHRKVKAGWVGGLVYLHGMKFPRLFFPVKEYFAVG